MAEDFNKGDFNKGNTGNRIDFHEAQRLSIEHFEKKYPKFCEFFNDNILKSTQLGGWRIDLVLETPFCKAIRNQDGYRRKELSVLVGENNQPTSNQEIIDYARHLGFDTSFDTHLRRITVSWSRRDGRKYP